MNIYSAPNLNINTQADNTNNCIVQELCESRGGRPGLSVRGRKAILNHASALVPNMSTDIRGH